MNSKWNSRRNQNQYDDEEYDFESHEAHCSFIDNKDYKGLLKYHKKMAERFPNDLHEQYLLGEAYNLNKQYENAIMFLDQWHKKYPDNIDFQYLILDALFALGKTEEDYNWSIKPDVLKLSNEIVDSCYDYLKPKRKPRSIYDVYIEFIVKGYLTFNEDDLLTAILNDKRFIVEDVEYFAGIRVVRKKDMKR